MRTCADTIGACKLELILFTFMLFILLLAFAFIFNMTFSTRVDEYSTIWFSLISLFRAGTGDIDYDALYFNEPELAPWVYIFYLTVSMFVGFTILIAVITAGYDRACELPPRKGVFNSTVKAYQRWRSSDEPKKKKKDAKPPATKVEMYRDIGSQMGDTLSMLQQKIDEQHEATVGRIAAMGDKFHARLDALIETM